MSEQQRRLLQRLRQRLRTHHEVGQRLLARDGELGFFQEVALDAPAAVAERADHGRRAGEDHRVDPHLRAAQLEDGGLALEPQMRATLGGEVRARRLGLAAQELGELRRAPPEPQGRAEERSGLARGGLGRGVAHQRGGERRQRMQRLADEASGDLRGGVRQELAQAPAFEESAGRERRRIVHRRLPRTAELVELLERGLGGGGVAAQLAPQLGLPPSRLDRQGEAQRLAQDLERPGRARRLPQIGRQSQLVERPRAAGKLPQRRDHRMGGGQQPTLALPRHRRRGERREQHPQPPLGEQRRRRRAADVGSDDGHVVDPPRRLGLANAGLRPVGRGGRERGLGRGGRGPGRGRGGVRGRGRVRLRGRCAHGCRLPSAGDQSARAASSCGAAIRTLRPCTSTRPSATSWIARG